MTTKKNKRLVDGILLLDKPLGVSSNSALSTVKKLFQATKAGHTGSLDPLASGLLPICLGEATKFSQFLLSANKRYGVVAMLGIKTSTGDREGEIIAKGDASVITINQIQASLHHFCGEGTQIPPMYSALKQNGQPLYKLARKGITVEREPRKIQIESIDFLGYQFPVLRLEVSCSKGTYIRTLIEDIGEHLGCYAHVIELRRVGIDGLPRDSMLSLSHLSSLYQSQGLSGLDTQLLPIDLPVQHLPKIELTPSQAVEIIHGRKLSLKSTMEEGLVRIYQEPGQFLGIGKVVESSVLEPKRLLGRTYSGFIIIEPL